MNALHKLLMGAAAVLFVVGTVLAIAQPGDLGDELGLDPSPELMELERAIVAHDPSLRWQGAEASA